jgi:putative membrane protein
MTANAAAPELPERVPFLDERAKARAVAAVRAFESQTSAELVVTVKKRARAYPEADLAWGALFAFLALLFLLFVPVDFSVSMMPVDTIVAFAAGFLLSRSLPPVARLAVLPKKRRAAVDQAAKAAFVDLGVSRTTGRTGVLVYVALFEGCVAIVADHGVTDEAKKAADEARAALEAALARSSMRAFA